MATPERIVSSDSLVLAPVRRQYPPQKWLVSGVSGVGKSRLLTGWPKPIHVSLFDGYGGAMQYLRFGGPTHSDIVPVDYSARGDGSCLVPTQYVFNKAGEIVMQLNFFHDDDWQVGNVKEYHGDGEGSGEWKELKGIGVPRPTAYARFLTVMAHFRNAEVASTWGTIALDSVKSMAISARWWSEYVLNPHAKDGGAHYASATTNLEKMLCGRWKSFPCDVYLIAHIERVRVAQRKGQVVAPPREEVMGAMVRKIDAPGRLARNDGLAAEYKENYYMYADKDGDRYLQTRIRGEHNASSSIDAPDPTFVDPTDARSTYLSLWENWS